MSRNLTLNNDFNNVRILLSNCLIVVCFFIFPSEGELLAQQQKSVAERLHTELNFDLLFPRERPNGLAAQEWADIFSRLKIPLRIRQPTANDKVGVDQQQFGTIRRVKVIGQLDRSGIIVFPDRKFSMSDIAKLEEWIEELKVYGAQGAPEGQPLWGLKQVEFDRLYAELKQPVEKPTDNLGFADAIRQLELPTNYPMRFSAETRELLANQPELPEVKNNLEKFAKGTALAMLLRGYQLSFAPRRLPDESIVLSIEPFDEKKKSWPIGWDPDSLGLKRLALSEKMFTAQVIEIEQLTLSELAPLLEKETSLPLFYDPQALSALNVNPDRIIVNYPRKRTSWSLCLRTVLAQLKLTQQVRVDENNEPFIWVTKFTPRTRAGRS